MGNDISSQKRIRFNIVSDKQEARMMLDNAEKEDMYVGECHDDKVNSIARRNLTYSPNTIPLRDLNYMMTYLEGATLPQRLNNELDTVNIIHLMPSADGGMPHTRPGEVICYPNISQVFSNITLIHELWHIHQRKYKNEWFKVFKRIGWSMWNGELPEQLENARRYNPDTIDCPLWIFDNQWVPIPIFKDITHPNVAEVEIWFYNVEKRYHSKSIPGEIASYFPNLPSSAYEHPREITAYMLSEPSRYKESQGFKHLVEAIGYISIVDTENVSN